MSLIHNIWYSCLWENLLLLIADWDGSALQWYNIGKDVNELKLSSYIIKLSSKMKNWIVKNATSAIKFSRRVIKNSDTFGVRVNLNYKGREKFPTFVGGLATLLMVGFLLQYFYNQVVSMVLRDSTVVNSGKKIYFDWRIYNFFIVQINDLKVIDKFKIYENFMLIF